MLALREIAMDLADPTTYRELTLLNRMLTGHDPEEDAARQAQADEEEAGRQRLEDIGLEPESAGSMVKALSALERIMRGEGTSALAVMPKDEPTALRILKGTDGDTPRPAKRRRTAPAETG